ncbi:RasGEF domain containing protein [Histomonas meleagridis]|uniref:RasGEF domain containing protein n=1 Tax=Histomonas meleagridis TaxID=135588 RepID=UPI003559CBFE|nr:RasGEF domain containing protein [Histomonas meleagridis]KAH0796500.1 RasGEF domain containing protein [Histomonas meleagridis]
MTSQAPSSSETSNTPDDLTEQRSQWLTKLLAENPQILALRERVLPWTGGYSFSNAVHTDTTTVLSHINRHKVLELVYQHFCAIGMNRTAETLIKESGHEYQKTDQPWEKTDLLLLVSLGILPREDPWTITEDPHHQLVEEYLEEDFFASSYRESVESISTELLDPSFNLVLVDDATNTKLETIKAASLKRLIVFLATTSSDQLSDDDIHRFFLTLHSITSSYHFLEHLMALFNCHLLQTDDEESHQKILNMQSQLRINVINLIKKWTNFHGLFIGRKTIKSIGQFIRQIVDNQSEYQNVAIYAKSILTSLPQLTYGQKSGVLPDPTQNPEIPDPQIIFRPNLRLIDPNPIEVARQITLLFHTSFKAVHSREFMVALSNQRVSHQTPTLAEFFDFGERLTLNALECIVMANDKTAVISQLLEIASNLEQLGNFDALARIVMALNREELRYLPVWQQQTQREMLKRLYERSGDYFRTQNEYIKAINERFEGWASTIPNLRVELTVDVADKSPSFIGGLINWQKRWSVSKKTLVLYRFQNKPYNYWPIPQIQKVINRPPTLSPEQIQEKLNDIRRAYNK